MPSVSRPTSVGDLFPGSARWFELADEVAVAAGRGAVLVRPTRPVQRPRRARGDRPQRRARCWWPTPPSTTRGSATRCCAGLTTAPVTSGPHRHDRITRRPRRRPESPLIRADLPADARRRRERSGPLGRSTHGARHALPTRHCASASSSKHRLDHPCTTMERNHHGRSRPTRQPSRSDQLRGRPQSRPRAAPHRAPTTAPVTTTSPSRWPTTPRCRPPGTAGCTVIESKLVDGSVPEVKNVKPPRTHWDMLLERRSIEELEEILTERLTELHSRRGVVADVGTVARSGRNAQRLAP